MNNRRDARGRLIVREIRDGVTIDFEKFEVLYLTVRVRDLNTVDGDDYDECKLHLVSFLTQNILSHKTIKTFS